MSFTDPRTGYHFQGMNVDVHIQARIVIDHRRANPTIYPSTEAIHFSYEDVVREIVEQVCNRAPQACYDDTKAFTAETPVSGGVKRKCYKCGSEDLRDILCPTCSGHRVLHRVCNKCSAIIPL